MEIGWGKPSILGVAPIYTSYHPCSSPVKVEVHPTLAVVMSEVEPGTQKRLGSRDVFWDPLVKVHFSSGCVMSEFSNTLHCLGILGIHPK